MREQDRLAQEIAAAEDCDECDEQDEHNEHNLVGLAPSDAGDWLGLQREFAWRPEAAGDLLRSGVGLAEIGAHLQPQQRLLASISDSCVGNSALTAHELGQLERLRIRVVPLTHASYPAPLFELVDAPLVLLVRGQVEALATPGIAIVGARAATATARATARRLGRELASVGITIVSGLARGVDAEAHRGALEAGGRTIGVLACGPDQIYPPEHRDLADEIMRSGAVISEMPLGVPPRKELFPLRNRIISGLSLGVIVVEARRRSGSLITVRHALGQGRDVFVVPGSIEGPFAEGSNQLLREGARPIRNARDVIEDLDYSTVGGRSLREMSALGQAATKAADPLSMRILAVLEDGPLSRDELLVHARLDAGELACVLLELELSGRIVHERDGRIHGRWS